MVSGEPGPAGAPRCASDSVTRYLLLAAFQRRSPRFTPKLAKLVKSVRVSSALLTSVAVDGLHAYMQPAPQRSAVVIFLVLNASADRSSGLAHALTAPSAVPPSTW